MAEMNYEEFTEWAVENVKYFLPEEYSESDVTVNHIVKPGSAYDGLIVRPEGQFAVPAINLGELYDQYANGSSLWNVGQKMADIVQITQPTFETFLLNNYESVKDHLFIRVCNAETNAELLRMIPHDRIEDLAITYHISISNENGSLASTTINNNLMRHWNISEEQLKTDAMTNSQKIFPEKTETLQNVVNDFIGTPAEDQSSPIMLVVTNDIGINGAAAAFYPGILEEISEKMNGDFYILPSSIHEVIAVPDNITTDYHTLESMVRNVNRIQVDKSEQLSSHVYHYDSQAKAFELAESYEQRIDNKTFDNWTDFEMNNSHETIHPQHSFTMKF